MTRPPETLLGDTRAWVVEVHPHSRHLERTLDWTLELDPAASEALQIAAVAHDIERAFPDPDATWDSARDWDSPGYNRWHQDRCADIIADRLRLEGAEPGLVAAVDRLVRAHEDGGWPEADLLQAADSLSFLETMAPLVGGWMATGRAPRERALAKLTSMYERMAVPRARELGAPLLTRAIAEADAEAEARSAGERVETPR